MVIRYDRAHRRVYCLGARIHHGLVGLLFVAIGLALLVDDRHDWPFPLKDVT